MQTVSTPSLQGKANRIGISPAAYAIKAYQTMLEKHGHRRADIYKRVHIARCIIGSLPHGYTLAAGYRKAVDTVLANMPDEQTMETCRQVARDFYPFFENDMPTIAAMMQVGAFERLDDIDIALPPHDTLDDLINRARARRLDAKETAALNAYSERLLTQRLDGKVLQMRIDLCRLLLLCLHGLPHDGKHYRAAINRILPLFRRDEARAYFLVVARQFFAVLYEGEKKPGSQ